MGDKFSPFLYDAVILYATSINETLARGDDPRNGVELMKSVKHKVIYG